MLDFRIETFLAVCDTMNYRQTAEQLHITQPAVTQHIQHLEKEYNCKLFSYKNRKLEKTRSATILEKYTRSMKINEDNMKRQLKNGEITELNIGATKTIGECVIGEYAEKFISGEENTLNLIVDNTEQLLNKIDNCELDFAIIEGQFDKNKYGYRFFRKEEFVGICSKSHPFAGRAVGLDELFKETLICREDGSGTRAILESKLLDFNESIVHFKRTVCISCFNMILDFVKKGYGISFVYEVLANHANLAKFTISSGKIEREFNFVYLKDTGAEEKIKHFIDK